MTDPADFPPLMNMHQLRMALKDYLPRIPSTRTLKMAMDSGMPWRRDPVGRKFPVFVLAEVLSCAADDLHKLGIFTDAEFESQKKNSCGTVAIPRWRLRMKSREVWR